MFQHSPGEARHAHTPSPGARPAVPPVVRADEPAQVVMQQLLGYKTLPSEGAESVLRTVPSVHGQRLLRHLIRRNPVNRCGLVHLCLCICMHGIHACVQHFWWAAARL